MPAETGTLDLPLGCREWIRHRKLPPWSLVPGTMADKTA
jgi:hypothetical protein